MLSYKITKTGLHARYFQFLYGYIQNFLSSSAVLLMVLDHERKNEIAEDFLHWITAFLNKYWQALHQNINIKTKKKTLSIFSKLII